MSTTVSIPAAQAVLSLAKARTGITGLDEITFGGLPAGRPTLICGGPGCGKTLLATTFLVNGAVMFNEPGVFMSFEETSEDLFVRLDYAIKSVGAKRDAENEGIPLLPKPYSLGDLAAQLTSALSRPGARWQSPHA
jgi:replicative DNA helicase